MRKASDLGGVTAMLAATAFYVVGDSFMKIVTADLPPFEVLFLRGIAASFACAVLVALRGEWSAISGMLNGSALLRAGCETLGTLCYIVALARMPIADVVAILQTAPLLLILAVAIILREESARRASHWRLLASQALYWWRNREPARFRPPHCLLLRPRC